MNITEFMKLPDAEKIKYTQVTYIDKDKANIWEYDLGIFENRQCEYCAPEDKTFYKKVYGTSDPREPKFCEKHFVEISEVTDFIKTEEYLSEKK